MEIQVTPGTIIAFAGLLAAIITIIGYMLKVHNWFLKQKNQDKEIEALRAKHEEDMAESKEERQMMCFSLAACLDGLEQLGCNHTVTEAKTRMNEYLNKQAHK